MTRISNELNPRATAIMILAVALKLLEREGGFMRIAVLGCFMLPILSVFAMNELGPLELAQRNHPAVFIPGNVLKYAIADEVGYVYNGEAEKYFEGSLSEKDSELYQEAELDAKKNLYAHLVKDKSTKDVIIIGARKLYQYPDGKMRRVVCFVNQKSITLRDKKVGVPVKVEQDSFRAAEAKIVTKMRKKSQTNSTSNAEDPLSECLREMAKNPSDCSIKSRAAKIYVRRGLFSEAQKLYASIVTHVIENEKIDKDFGASLLLEAAKFEKDYGNANTALKYYRLIVRCNGLRRWNQDAPVEEANKNIAELLQKSL